MAIGIKIFEAELKIPTISSALSFQLMLVQRVSLKQLMTMVEA